MDKFASRMGQEGAYHMSPCASLGHIRLILREPWQGHCYPMVMGETKAQKGQLAELPNTGPTSLPVEALGPPQCNRKI